LDVHVSFLAALLALVAVLEGGQHPTQTGRFVDRLAWPERATVQTVCSNVELTVACMPLSDILSDDGGVQPVSVP
jgi:hypothetical protein